MTLSAKDRRIPAHMDLDTMLRGERREVAQLTSATALLLRLTTAMSGAVLMSLEVLGFRIIGRTFGSALRETSVVIGVFLAAMSLGYYFGGRLADRYPRLRTLVGALLLATAFIAIVPWLDALVAQRVFESAIPLGFHSAVVTTVLFFLPTIALASVSPIAIRLLATGVGESGRTAGTISAISTVGSIVGSVGTAFVLIDLIRSVDRTVWLLSIVMLVLALLMAASQAGSVVSKTRWRRVVIVAATAALGAQLLFSGAWWLLRDAPSSSAAIESGETEVFRRDSSFHQIRVGENSTHRTLYFDRQRQTRILIGNPLEGGLGYTDFFHFGPVVKASMKRVLFIGVGGGTGPTRFAHDYPEAEIDGVEVDAVVVDVAKRYFGLTPGSKLRVHVDDGRAFLRRSGGGYDVIVVDAYSHNRYGSTIPAHLTTREFFEECRDKLAPGGVIVFNCAWSPRAAITRAISRTLHAVFPGQLVFSRGNTIFIAGPESIEHLRLRLADETRAAIESGSVSFPLGADEVQSLVPPMKVGNAPVLTDDYSPVDTLIRQGER